jgi:transcription antitermination factor NusG
MQRNWYVICTQQKQEKKVAAMLTKKGIENFCPFTITEVKNVSRSSREYGPLFKSYVFVNATETDVGMITKMQYVVNPLYWRSKPAIINADEINAIKMMVENYTVIRPEKYVVNTNDNVGIVEQKITGYNNHVTTIKHQGISITLPTLGYALVSEREKARASPAAQKKDSLSASIAKKLNLLSLFGF